MCIINRLEYCRECLNRSLAHIDPTLYTQRRVTYQAWSGLPEMSKQTIGSLLVRQMSGAESVIAIRDGEELKVGRDPSCEITLDDPGVSRVHASFSASSRGIVIADLNSLNGVFVNGRKLLNMRDLNSRDIIDIGSSKIEVELNSSHIVENTSSGTRARAMTAQLRPMSVTTLVASVNGYHHLSDQLPTDDVVQMLIQWTAMVTESVNSSLGVVDKVIGHSVVSLWASQSDQENASMAIQTAAAIQAKTADLVSANGWKHQAAHPWSSSVVVNSGFAMSGALGASGEEQNKGFTLMGDPINQAFELQGFVDMLDCSVIIGSSTAELLGENSGLKRLAQVPLRQEGTSAIVYTIA